MFYYVTKELSLVLSTKINMSINQLSMELHKWARENHNIPSKRVRAIVKRTNKKRFRVNMLMRTRNMKKLRMHVAMKLWMNAMVLLLSMSVAKTSATKSTDECAQNQNISRKYPWILKTDMKNVPKRYKVCTGPTFFESCI